MPGIEDLIKQKKFKNDYQKGMISLLYVVNQINDHQAEFFKPHKLSKQQYNVLLILRGQFPHACNINTIKKRMLDKNSDVSRIVNRLCKTNLITVTICKKDRRAVDIIINNNGIKVLNTIDEDIEKIEKPLMALDDKEINHLNGLLEKIIIKLNKKK
jgi:DNA-binding MarR family transcriptional regulator